MDDQPLTEQKQAGELPGLEDPALAVLAGDLHPDLERRPTAISRSPSAFASTNCCHGSKLEPGHRRELGRLLPVEETNSGT
jgi:hypothetical protein